MDLTKKTIASQEELENGFEKLTLSDGTILIGMFTVLAASAPVAEEKAGKKTAKKEPDPVDIPEDWDELKEMDEDDMKALIEQEEYDIDPDDMDEDEIRAALAEELEIEVPKKGKKEEPKKGKAAPTPEPEDELTWEDIDDMDEEELADLIEEEELDIDPADDEFEDDIDALKKAVAEALEIKVPKKKKANK